MAHIPLLEIADAPAASRPQMEASVKAFGMLPGLHKALANSPKALEAYKTLHELFQQTAFTDTEKHVVWQSINVEHGCHYCQPAHSAIAGMMGVEKRIDTALRAQTPLGNAKLEALRSFTLAVVRRRGQIDEADLQAFYTAGYDAQAAMEVLLGLAQKVMSNYTNHIAHTPVDPAFEKFVATAA